MNYTRKSRKLKQRGGNPNPDLIPDIAYLIVGVNRRTDVEYLNNPQIYTFDLDAPNVIPPRHIMGNFNDKLFMEKFVKDYTHKFAQVIIDTNVIKFYSGNKIDLLNMFLNVVKPGGQLIYQFMLDYGLELPDIIQSLTTTNHIIKNTNNFETRKAKSGKLIEILTHYYGPNWLHSTDYKSDRILSTRNRTEAITKQLGLPYKIYNLEELRDTSEIAYNVFLKKTLLEPIYFSVTKVQSGGKKRKNYTKKRRT